MKKTIYDHISDWGPGLIFIQKRTILNDCCEGLEMAAAWGTHHIVDRIMGDDKWHRDFWVRRNPSGS